MNVFLRNIQPLPGKSNIKARNLPGIGRKCAGLTLFELLVVIAIIGIASTMIVVSFDFGDPHENIKTEAKRLASLIRFAIDESIITGSDMALALTSDGYRFFHYEYETKPSTLLEADDVLSPRALPENITLDLISVDSVTLPTLPTNDTIRPQIAFLSSGEITPFELSILNEYGEEKYRIAGRWNGSVELKANEQ
jgi:general secretion pathway protein H